MSDTNDSDTDSDSSTGSLYCSSFLSFLSPTPHSDLVSALEYDKAFGFNFVDKLGAMLDAANRLQEEKGVDERDDVDVDPTYVCIRLINALRTLEKPSVSDLNGVDPIACLDNKYYRPVDDEDGYLACVDDIFDIHALSTASASDSKPPSVEESGDAVSTEVTVDDMTIEQLRFSLKSAKSIIATLSDSSSLPPLPPPTTSTSTPTSTEPQAQDNDTYYFDSYSSSSIHETMLKDQIRTQTYRSSISSNKSNMFENATVIDVGCGTGVLSVFVAKEGGSCNVVGLDMSETIEHARKIVDVNGFSDKIKLLKGKVEDMCESGEIERLVDGKNCVDVVVSEWMGYGLLYESMLPSVIKIRDTFMKPIAEGGTMWPSGCRLFIELMQDGGKEDFWEDVYGINMDTMKGVVRNERHGLKRPKAKYFNPETVVEEGCCDAIVQIVEQKYVVSSERNVCWVCDLNTVKDEELDFTRDFELIINKDNITKGFNAFLLAFDCTFTPPSLLGNRVGFDGGVEVSFDTSARATSTHWMQTVLYIEDGLLINGSDYNGDVTITGKLDLRRAAKNPRDIEFLVEWRVEGGDGKKGGVGRQRWALSS